MANLYSAKTLLDQGKIVEARSAYDELLQAIVPLKASPEKTNEFLEALFGRTLTSFYLDNENLELEFKHCHQLFSQKATPELLLSLFQLMAENYIEKNNYIEALKYIDEATATLTKWNVRILQTIFECYKIIILCREELPHKAKSLLRVAEERYSEEFFFHLLEGHLEIKAEIALAEGNYEAAQFLFEDAAVKSRKISKFNEMMLYHRGAMASQHKTPKSTQLHQKSLDMAMELGLTKRQRSFNSGFSLLPELRQKSVDIRENHSKQTIKLCGFGNLQVFLENQPTPLNKKDWQSEKSRKLFLYIILNKPTQCTKEKIIDRVWPEKHNSKSLNNLFHVSVSNIRKLMGFQDIISNNEGIYILDTDRLWIDWVEFKSNVEKGIQDERTGNIDSAYANFKQAKSLYTDDLLLEFSDDWIAEHRDHFKRLLEKCLQHYGNLLEEDRLYQDALTLMEELIKINPFDDYGYQSAIRLASLLDKTAMATDIYENYRLMLLEEFGLQPSPSFKRIYDEFVRKL